MTDQNKTESEIRSKTQIRKHMKIRTLTILAALLASAGFSRADIISNSIAADGDGVITCEVYPFIKNSTGDFQVTIDGIQHNMGNPWEPGHILGDIITDTELDPTLALNNSIDNDTGIAWGDYHVMVTMNKSFTFSNVGVANSGWTYTPPATPSQVGSDWIGYIDYYGYGNPVLALGTLDFNYSITFTGSVSFTEQLTPSSVPEPGTFALMVVGGLAGLLANRRRL
jgi:hypothetical protein